MHRKTQEGMSMTRMGCPNKQQWRRERASFLIGSCTSWRKLDCLHSTSSSVSFSLFMAFWILNGNANAALHVVSDEHNSLFHNSAAVSGVWKLLTPYSFKDIKCMTLEFRIIIYTCCTLFHDMRAQRSIHTFSYKYNFWQHVKQVVQVQNHKYNICMFQVYAFLWKFLTSMNL